MSDHSLISTWGCIICSNVWFAADNPWGFAFMLAAMASTYVELRARS